MRGLPPWFLCLALLMSVRCHALTADDFFHETLGDLSDELATAKDEGKQGLFVFFEMDDCPFCYRMKQTILNQPEVIDWYGRHFINIRVDTEGDTELVNFDGQTMKSKDFALKLHRVRATPVLAFFDLQGNRVARVTGAVDTVQEFLWLGEYVTGRHYETTNFTRFKRDKQAAGAPN